VGPVETRKQPPGVLLMSLRPPFLSDDQFPIPKESFIMKHKRLKRLACRSPGSLKTARELEEIVNKKIEFLKKTCTKRYAVIQKLQKEIMELKCTHRPLPASQLLKLEL